MRGLMLFHLRHSGIPSCESAINIQYQYHKTNNNAAAIVYHARSQAPGTRVQCVPLLWVHHSIHVYEALAIGRVGANFHQNCMQRKRSFGTNQ